MSIRPESLLHDVGITPILFILSPFFFCSHGGALQKGEAGYSRLEPIALRSDSYEYAIGRSVLKEINLIADDCVRRYFLTYTLWGYVLFFFIHQLQLPRRNDVITLRRKI